MNEKIYRSTFAPAKQASSAGEVPEWAWERVKEVCRAETRDKHFSPNRDYPTAICLARYIAAHEPEPVDPLVEEIREQLGPKFKHLAPLVADEHRKELRQRGVTAGSAG